MKKTTVYLFCILLSQTIIAQIKLGAPCASKQELQDVAGKYQTASQYPWPAVRAAYFSNLSAAADKAIAKQTLGQIEILEQKSRTNFNFTGGFWEAYYSTEGYKYAGNKKLADYRFQIALHEYICINKKATRNDEYSTILRVYLNTIPFNEMSRHLEMALNGYLNLGNYIYKDWKNYKLGGVAPTIELANYITVKNDGLANTINTGDGYWQDIPEKQIRKNTYDHIYRYWFITKNNMPLLVPVTRKEYLESLLEYFEREKLYFAKQSAGSGKGYENWQGIVEGKKAKVASLLKENNAEWLSKQAVINFTEDSYQNQKQKLPEYTSSFTFRKFYDNEKGACPLYKYNPACFSATTQSPANPQFITLSFRYVSMPVHLRLLDNFTKNFDRTAWGQLLK